MAKILFDIAALDAGGLRDGQLLLEIGPHIFAYAATNREKQLLHMRFYELDAIDPHDLATEIATLIGNDVFLQSPAAKTTLLYNFPESQLVPEAYFHSSNGKDIINLLHGDLNKGVILSERIQGRPQYNVYQVPAEIHNLMQRSFSNGKYWHYYSLWISLLQPSAEQTASFVSVLFYPNRILVKAVKDEQLYLIQSYAYEAAEDAGFHLLNICLQLSLAPETTPVILSGMIEGSSALYTEIHKYFGQVSLEAFPGAGAVAGLEEYPAHFFSPLLKLAQCV